MNATAKPSAGFYLSPMFHGMFFKRRAELVAPTDTATVRTPKQHRAAIEKWRKTAPANDSEIFGRKQKVDLPRHRGLGDMAGLLAYRNRPMGVAEGKGARIREFAALATNWSVVSANDNLPPDDGFGVERAVECEPSLNMIAEAVKTLQLRHRFEPSMLNAKGKDREIHGIPTGGSIEYGSFTDDEGKRHKCVVRIGSLRFSDGTQKERGQKLVFGEAVDADIRMPVGAMLGCREKSARDKGAAIDETGSNSHYRWMVHGKTAKQLKRNVRPKERLVISKLEARAMLAKAIDNTPVMPDVTKGPDGFPYGPSALRQLFIAGRKGKNGETGSMAWEDIAVEKENRRQYEEAIDAMSEGELQILQDATTAKSLSQLGEARGYKGRHAIDAGRRLLVAANDNFAEALELAKRAAES